MYSERRTLISTDTVGALGNFHALREVWDQELLNSVEMIGWRRGFDSLLQEAKELDYNVACIHGPIMASLRGDSLLRLAVTVVPNLMLIPTPELVTYGQEYEILVHAANLEDPNNMRAIIESNPQLVWVENNSPGRDGFMEAMRTVSDLREQGVNAGMMLDMCHYIGTENLGDEQRFYREWDDALELISRELASTLENKVELMPVGIHFPIGTDRGDSLPIKIISDEMLRDFAAVISSARVASLTLESQPGELWDMICLRAGTIEKQRRRNDLIYNRLARTGIV